MFIADECRRTSSARLAAIMLAIGGSFWGAFLFLIGGISALFAPPFALGYLITAGYIIRVFTLPSLDWRRAIWIASILVQGGWFAVLVVMDPFGDSSPHDGLVGIRDGLIGVGVGCGEVAEVVSVAALRFGHG